MASGLARPSGWHERDVRCAADRRGGRAVDEARDVAPAVGGEGPLLRPQVGRGGHGFDRRPGAVPGPVGLGPADPHPGIVLRRWYAMAAGAGDRLERLEVVGASSAATARHARGPNARTRFTPPAATS